MTKVEGAVVPHAIPYLEKEIKSIQDDSIQAFAYNALAVAPQSFHDDQDLLNYIKKTFHILRGMLEYRDVQGAVRDAMLVTVLIAKIMYNEVSEELREIHSLAARPYFTKRDVHKDINIGLWENIMRAVESHQGDKTPSKILAPQPGTAEYEIAQAFAVAKLDYVEVNWKTIYETI